MINMVKQFVSILLPEDTFKKIDELRGDVPRSAYCRKLIIKSLESDNKKGGRTK